MRQKIILVCSECLNRNYTTFKNKDTQKDRLELKKFCSFCNQSIVHKETR